MKRLPPVVLAALVGCSGRHLDDGAGSNEGTEATPTTTATPTTLADASGSTSADSTAGTGGDDFDPCTEVLIGSWDIADIDRVGDLDGDGVHEIVVLERAVEETEPKIHVITADVAQVGDRTLTERVVQEIVFGPGFPLLDTTKIAGLGDVNGDGWPDLGVTTFVPDDPGEPGVHVRVYVLLGTAQPDPVREIRIDGQDGPGWWLDGAPSGFYGDEANAISLATVGDVNGDGLADLFVQPGDGHTFWVVFGRLDAEGTLPLGDLAATGEGFRVVYSSHTEAVMERNAVPVGDVNGDELIDLAIGAPGIGGGLLTVVFGQVPPRDVEFEPSSPDLRQVVAAGGAGRLGVAVLGIGQQDETPGDELWVSAPGETVQEGPGPCPPEEYYNSLYVLRGGPAESFSSDELLTGDRGFPVQGPCGSGLAIAVGGDLNDDGANDLVMTNDRGELLWFSDGEAGTNVNSSLSDLRSRLVDHCLQPDGLARLAPHEGRRVLFLGPDVTGDGIADILAVVAKVGFPPRRLAIFPGSHRW